MENMGTVTGAVIGVVTATTSLAIAFGVHLSTAEREAIIAEATAITAVAPLIGAAFDHGKKQAQARLDAAKEMQTKP